MQLSITRQCCTQNTARKSTLDAGTVCLISDFEGLYHLFLKYREIMCRCSHMRQRYDYVKHTVFKADRNRSGVK